MDKHQIFAGILVVLLGIVIGFRFIFPEDTWICSNNQWVRHGNPSTPKPLTGCGEVVIPTPTLSPTPTKTPLQTYNNKKMGFSLVYPQDLTLNNNTDGSISFIKNGPTQKQNTDFMDGINVHIVQGDLGVNKDLYSLVRSDMIQKEAQLTPDFTVLEQIAPYDLWYKPGAYAYKTREPFGEVSYFYLPTLGKKFLLVSVRTPDPKNQGFASTAAAMVQSIRIL
ncbi:MAG TPA: hypothetical protein VF837_02205 [Patescibacteria group bacterium]